jgi:hypothetical protein
LFAVRKLPLRTSSPKAFDSRPVALQNKFDFFRLIRKELRMQEIINAIAQKAGIDSRTATLVVGIILGFIQKEAPQGAAAKVLAAFPDAPAIIAQAQAAGTATSGLGGLVGRLGAAIGGKTGDAAALFSELMATGITMAQLETAGEVLLNGVRKEAGANVVADLIKHVPALGRLGAA